MDTYTATSCLGPRLLDLCHPPRQDCRTQLGVECARISVLLAHVVTNDWTQCNTHFPCVSVAPYQEVVQETQESRTWLLPLRAICEDECVYLQKKAKILVKRKGEFRLLHENGNTGLSSGERPGLCYFWCMDETELQPSRAIRHPLAQSKAEAGRIVRFPPLYNSKTLSFQGC